jgi:hypothetical protein
MAKKPASIGNPLKALMQALKVLLDPAPHSGDDDAAQAEAESTSSASV